MLNLIAIVVFGGLGIYSLRQLFRLRKIGRFTKGKVVKFGQGFRGSSFAVIRFNTSQGRFELTSGKMFPRYKLGDSVPILYNPKNPRDALIYRSRYVWLWPLGLIGLGLYAAYDLIVRLLGSLS